MKLLKVVIFAALVLVELSLAAEWHRADDGHRYYIEPEYEVTFFKN